MTDYLKYISMILVVQLLIIFSKVFLLYQSKLCFKIVRDCLLGAMILLNVVLISETNIKFDRSPFIYGFYVSLFLNYNFRTIFNNKIKLLVLLFLMVYTAARVASRNPSLLFEFIAGEMMFIYIVISQSFLTHRRLVNRIAVK